MCKSARIGGDRGFRLRYEAKAETELLVVLLGRLGCCSFARAACSRWARAEEAEASARLSVKLRERSAFVEEENGASQGRNS